MQVNIDIILNWYPCGLVSLDIMDILHTHSMDVKEGLKKTRIDKNKKNIKEFRAI